MGCPMTHETCGPEWWPSFVLLVLKGVGRGPEPSPGSATENAPLVD